MFNLRLTLAAQYKTSGQNLTTMSTTEFSRQISLFEEMLRAFAYSLTRNEEASKDLFQETTYRAVKNKEKFEEGSNLKAWLFTIMKNIFINDYRKKKKANTIFDSTDNQYFINSSVKRGENEGESSILIQELFELINQLEDQLRIPFLMHYKGYKYQEIADRFDLPLGTVKSRIFFARRLLKDQIKKRYKNVDELLVRA